MPTRQASAIECRNTKRRIEPSWPNQLVAVEATTIAKARLHDIPIKKHGRRAWSLFALGLNTLRKLFVAASPDQIIAFLAELLSPKLPVKPLRALAFRKRVEYDGRRYSCTTAAKVFSRRRRAAWRASSSATAGSMPLSI